MRPQCARVGPDARWFVSPEKGNFGHRHKHTVRTPCEHEDRDWGDASTGQRTPQLASKAGNPGVRSGGPLLTAAQGPPCPHLGHGLQPLEASDEELLLLLTHLCVWSLRPQRANSGLGASEPPTLASPELWPRAPRTGWRLLLPLGCVSGAQPSCEPDLRGPCSSNCHPGGLDRKDSGSPEKGGSMTPGVLRSQPVPTASPGQGDLPVPGRRAGCRRQAPWSRLHHRSSAPPAPTAPPVLPPCPSCT